jgi:hypothetical protein
VGNTSETFLIAIRMNSEMDASYNIVNRSKARVNRMFITKNDTANIFVYRIYHGESASASVLNGTWSRVNSLSGVDHNLDATSFDVSNDTLIDAQVFISQDASVELFPGDLSIMRNYDNTDSGVYVLTVQRFTSSGLSSATIYSGIRWVEIR